MNTLRLIAGELTSPRSVAPYRGYASFWMGLQFILLSLVALVFMAPFRTALVGFALALALIATTVAYALIISALLDYFFSRMLVPLTPLVLAASVPILVFSSLYLAPTLLSLLLGCVVLYMALTLLTAFRTPEEGAL